MTERSEILRAASEAARVFADFPHGKRTSFDIVGAIMGMSIPLVFQPLENLIGTAVTIGRARGIMISTKRDLHVQRFTLAHELGHLRLGHPFKLDETIGFAGRNAPESRPIQERAADTFASELLGPKSLMLESAKRHRWNKKKLHQPDNIYQLSLRLGISYKATCWALVTAGVLDRREAGKLEAEPVKDQKRALVPEELITNSWADVWALARADSETFLEAGPDDLFAVHVQDQASAGYLWQLVDTGANAEIVGERSMNLDHAYGEQSSRTVYVRFASPGTHRLVFEHVRPWSGATLDHIEIDIDSHGKERAGLARRAKQQALALAA